MRLSPALAAIALLCCSPILGCGSANSKPAVAPAEEELTEFLKDNPETTRRAEVEDEKEDETEGD